MKETLKNPNVLQESPFKQELLDLADGVKNSEKMPKGIRDYVNGCEKRNSLTDDEFKKYMGYVKEYNRPCYLGNLVSATDYQIKGIVDYEIECSEKNKSRASLHLDNLTTITDKQAMELSKLQDLWLDGLTSINDKQAELLGKLSRLSLDSLKRITDKQAELLSKVKYLSLSGLTSVTDNQAKSLSKVEWLYMYGNSDILTPGQEKIIFGKHNHFNGYVRNSY